MTSKEGAAARPVLRCPVCGSPRAERFRPFCSARCRDVDLGRWFTEAYAVPVVEPEDAEEEEATAAKDGDEPSG
jgi:endogenous inhibitor of DNA gyrase (YacG/DUF329 family)